MAMTDERTESVLSYLQVGSAARTPLFPAFLKALNQAEPDQAKVWASRAVSPKLDYSSMMRLGKYVIPAESAASANPLRIGILGGPTTIQLRQALEVFLAAEGIAARIYEAEYGLFRQEILAPGSGLDRFNPQIIFLATSVRDVARFPAMCDGEAAVAQLAQEEVADWQRLWETANHRWNATLVQNNFEIPPHDPFGHFSRRHAASYSNYIERLNRLMSFQSPSHVVLHDLHRLASEIGANQWFDPRFYHQFKMPCGGESLVAYAHSVFSLLRAIVGRSKKVVVLDLDNTLWGGVVGDVGPGGIQFGQGSGEGEAFLAFQSYLKQLQERGVILAVCSKNQEGNAREPFERREDMILKLSDFACFVANFQNKADNLRTIAERLDLKLDSFVFVDDNPAERAVVRRCASEVAVPDMPEDPAGYIQALASYRYFETVSFTHEDSLRARCYAENAKRREIAANAADVDSFLASLAMQMRVAPINDLNIERATQLINKSNQFNLTTHRYTLAQIQEMANSPDWQTFTFSLRDSLGDNGLISVLLLRRDGDALTIDTWVMSCRVLLRGVEQCVCNELVEFARREGFRQLRGEYIPTPKNTLVQDLYATLGFAQIGKSGDTTHWALTIDNSIPLPSFQHHITCEYAHGQCT